jgi:hypothetical protein
VQQLGGTQSLSRHGTNATASSDQPVTVKQLNPTTDPGGSCPQPYSSGSGFQGTPQVVSDSVSLSQFDNESIQLRF